MSSSLLSFEQRNDSFNEFLQNDTALLVQYSFEQCLTVLQFANSSKVSAFSSKISFAKKYDLKRACSDIELELD